MYGTVILPHILRTKDEIFGVDEYVRDLDTTFAEVKTAIERFNVQHKEVADQHQRDSIYSWEIGLFSQV